MNRQTSKLYKDYPNQPYISLERNLDEWEKYPEHFHYGVVPKINMEYLEEMIFPGDVIMLWRICFNNFHNKSIIPAYFEYKYGINSDESIQKLIKKGYVRVDNFKDSLDLYSMTELKRLLSIKKLKLSGNKKEVLERVSNNFNEDELKNHLDRFRYVITVKGMDILEKYNSIIQKHGPKE